MDDASKSEGRTCVAGERGGDDPVIMSRTPAYVCQRKQMTGRVRERLVAAELWANDARVAIE